ncbi:MAG: glutamine--fructose-6-phosphate transaminase (isomerizing) [Chloroflexota bacterium]|nr:glutamine--fructose-6-phosphate transaminase (isomerizing) [Chloroflexota bacterium]
MCGLFGYIGARDAVPVLLDGLRRVEYRGYDSSGIALADGGPALKVFKALGKVENLTRALAGANVGAQVGVAHTRWATHGAVALENAHPLTDCTGTLAVVHNGIVENHAALRTELVGRGHRFTSCTDSEVICHLLEEAVANGLELRQACAQVARRLEGGNVFVALNGRTPDLIAGARVGVSGGLLAGLADGEACLVSDLAATPPWAARVAFVEPGEVVSLDRDGAKFYRLSGAPVTRSAAPAPARAASTAAAEYPHLMLKEICEQPETAATLLRTLLDCSGVRGLCSDAFPGRDLLRGMRRVVLTGCGTSYHAALVGRHYVETLGGMPAQAEVASELLQRERLLGKDTLLVAISQSGETADVLNAMSQARERGCRVVAISNAQGSQATRLAHYTLPMMAGPEVSVASTKTFMASLMNLYLFSIHLGVQRRALSSERTGRLLAEAAELPNALGGLTYASEGAEALARIYRDVRDIFLLGRGPLYPIALEGALKLKEVCYIHAEGVAGGEIKHGPISLADEQLLVVALAFRGPSLVKMLNNVSELKARGARVIVVTDDDAVGRQVRVDHIVLAPHVGEALAPLVAAVPIQQLAYYLGAALGRDVDKPRNLAKVVVVE